MRKHKHVLVGAILSLGLTGLFQARSASLSRPTETGAPVRQDSSWASPPRLDLAATVGEQLEYRVSWTGYLEAARVRMEMRKRVSVSDHDELQLEMEVQTVGLVRSLFLVLDNGFTSYLNPSSMLPFRFERKVREGREYSESTVLFDQKAGTAHLDSGKTIPISADTRDVVALFYFLRTLDLSSGRHYRLTGFYKDHPFTILAGPEERGAIKSPRGTVDAIKIALRGIEGEGETERVTDKYQLRLWLSNDSRRVPLLITAHPTFGEVEVQLVSRRR